MNDSKTLKVMEEALRACMVESQESTRSFAKAGLTGDAVKAAFFASGLTSSLIYIGAALEHHTGESVLDYAIRLGLAPEVAKQAIEKMEAVGVLDKVRAKFAPEEAVMEN